jgi:hypothetical protein
MCPQFRDGSAVIRRGNGNDAGAAPIPWPAPKTRRGPRLITSMAGRNPGTLDISSKAQAFVTT